ncbi:MAG TPA: hypothetical protein VIQ53_26695 [Inquilinus sp.]
MIRRRAQAPVPDEEPDDAEPDPVAARVAEVLAELLARAEAEGVPVMFDRCVGEAGLATLLSYTTGGLKHSRWSGLAPPHRRVGRRIRYALVDVARWLVDGEQN